MCAIGGGQVMIRVCVGGWAGSDRGERAGAGRLRLRPPQRSLRSSFHTCPLPSLSLSPHSSTASFLPSLTAAVLAQRHWLVASAGRDACSLWLRGAQARSSCSQRPSTASGPPSWLRCTLPRARTLAAFAQTSRPSLDEEGLRLWWRSCRVHGSGGGREMCR